MSSAYVSRLCEKGDASVVVRVFQMHPDYGLDADDFLLDFGAFAVAGFAFSDADPTTDRGHTTGRRAALRTDGRLAQALAGVAPLYGVGADEVADHLRVSAVEVIRSRWSDQNRDERLAAAGVGGAELTPSVVAQIAGVLELRVDDPEGYFREVPIDAEWTY